MGTAICFKCGSEKSSALLACDACGATPRTENELLASLVLSEYLSTKAQLADFSNKIRNHLKIPAPPNVVAQAQAVLKDSQLIAMLGAWVTSSAPAKPIPAPTPSRPTVTPQAQPVRGAAPAQPARGAAPAQVPGRRVLKSTVLHQTPFAILGVTSRDNRRRIVELAEEKSLELDQEVCQKARADLTNPRTRLSAEMAWLPGVSPRRAHNFLESLLKDPLRFCYELGSTGDLDKFLGNLKNGAMSRWEDIPTLALLNLFAAALEGVDEECDIKDLSWFIQNIALIVDLLVPEDILRDINEDRIVSGFPEVRLDQIEDELIERKRYYLSAAKGVLDRLPSSTLVQVLTDTVERSTYCGEEQAPELIDDLVDSYEVETQDFLQKEAENVRKLIQAVRDAASSGETAVQPYVDKLVAVASNWDKVAQPIQLSAKSRGIDHDASIALAYEIRSLAVYLFNEYGMLAQSQRLTALLQELFVELPEVFERVEEDADALAEIFQERQQATERKEEWEREITYSAKVGVMFKDTLSISPAGISWKGKNFPLDSITRVRWGGVSRKVNNMPVGTFFTIAFGDSRSEAVIELRNGDIFNTFIEKLWRAVCVPMLFKMLEKLKNGQDLYFGDAILHDDGMTLVKHKLLGKNERVRCTWEQVMKVSYLGILRIWNFDDEKTYVELSYIHVANAHLLDQLLSMAFKKSGLRRLSELLQ